MNEDDEQFVSLAMGYSVSEVEELAHAGEAGLHARADGMGWAHHADRLTS